MDYGSASLGSLCPKSKMVMILGGFVENRPFPFFSLSSRKSQIKMKSTESRVW